MFVVACSRCQIRLTEKLFTNYDEAEMAARMLGYPVAGNSDNLWCEACATRERRLALDEDRLLRPTR